MAGRLVLGYTRDFSSDRGKPVWTGAGQFGLDGLDLEIRFLEQPYAVAPSWDIDQQDVLVSSAARYDAASFDGVERLTLLARYGVGYDGIDLDAATRAGVMVSITRGAPDRSIAEGALTLMLAIGHHLVIKDRLTRTGRWAERREWVGVDLRDRVVGIVGFGGIGRALYQLIRPFGLSRILVHDPYLDPSAVLAAGAEPVDLETLLSESDWVSIHCPLTDSTRGLIGARELRRMKPTAFLVNTARGPIVDQDALAVALREGWIRGAGIDVFREEPIDPNDPLLALDNVIVTPHYVGVTEDMAREYHLSIARAIRAVLRGDPPEHVVNPAVLDHPALRRKLDALRSA